MEEARQEMEEKEYELNEEDSFSEDVQSPPVAAAAEDNNHEVIVDGCEDVERHSSSSSSSSSSDGAAEHPDEPSSIPAMTTASSANVDDDQHDEPTTPTEHSQYPICAALLSATQPCIPLASLNRVPVLIRGGKGGNITSAGWQVTPCDPMWHVSFRSGEACLRTAVLHLLYLLYFAVRVLTDGGYDVPHGSTLTAFRLTCDFRRTWKG